ncbi:MAG: DUF4147 domain-containing protein [Planctomycetota bacterium]
MGHPDLKSDARRIFDAAVAAADPAACVRRALKGRRFRGPVAVVGAGKAAVPMARAVQEAVPRAAGVVVTKRGHGGAIDSIRVLQAAHPVPSRGGVRATREILEALGDRPVICLLSGGGSALLTAPAKGLTLQDKRETTDLLLRSGATCTIGSRRASGAGWRRAARRRPSRATRSSGASRT